MITMALFTTLQSPRYMLSSDGTALVSCSKEDATCITVDIRKLLLKNDCKSYLRLEAKRSIQPLPIFILTVAAKNLKLCMIIFI